MNEYQTLLTASESLSTLERVVKLVWNVLGGRIVPTESGLSVEPSVAGGAELAKRIQASPWPHGAHDIQRWRDLVSAHRGRNREHRRLRSLVIEASTALTAGPEAGALANLSSGRYSLFMDSCLLLAHHAYFALLPKVDDQRYAAERALLLSAFQSFADSSSEPADRFSLLALYFDALEKPQQASEARRAALAATPSDAHEFLTVLQSFWASLVERGMLSEALELLLETYPRVSRRDLDEVGDLIRQTFRQATAGNGHSRPNDKTPGRRKS